MNMPVARKVIRGELEDAGAHLGKLHDLRIKPMFGGLMAWLDEKPCAWLAPAGLAMKLAPPINRPCCSWRVPRG